MNPEQHPDTNEHNEPSPELPGEPGEQASGMRPLRPPGPGSSSASPSGSLVGRRFGDYQLLRKLGRGGMADVYAARHLTLGRDVAIKVLRSDFARDNDYVERFRREARAAAKLNHPSIVQVYDVGNVDSLYYIAQELIDGGNLKEYLDRVGTISVSEAVDVLIGVGSALEAAAETGIIHRDIKPENIMRSSKGVIKVADFGLVRLAPEAGHGKTELTQAGLTLGTPRYMSPEQVQGHPLDVRSDLYSLGVTTYHLLAGRPPFEADDPLALAVMHLHESPGPINRARGKNDLPEWLITVVSRLMQKSPAERFQTPAELVHAVQSGAGIAGTASYAQVGRAAATVRLQQASDVAREQQKRRIAHWAGLIAVPVLAAVVAGWLASQRPAPDIYEQLVPDTVEKAPTVQEQYLMAIMRDDPAGWRAVGEYFPPEQSATYADYYRKAQLQLSRWLIEHQQWQPAETVLRDLTRGSDVSALYRAIALVRLCELADNKADQAGRQEAMRLLKQQWDLLNPKAREVFNDVIPTEERIKWKLSEISPTMPS